MAVPRTKLWPADPHTEAKHQMLKEYLMAWFPIVVKQFPTGATFVDAFAGPGEYPNGKIGSPLIALQQAHRDDVLSIGHPIRLVFIEKHHARFEHLQNLVERRYPRSGQAPHMSMHLENGPCEDRLWIAVEAVRGWGPGMFVNLDGWGVDTPYELVTAIGRERSSEVLVTFKTEFFYRFATVEEIKKADRVFGGQDWRPIGQRGTPEEKKKNLVNLYRDRLRQAGFEYTLVFELIDEGGHELLLVFGTQSVYGVEKMKEAMWKVDPSHGQQFRDPRDINQGVFNFGATPQTALLERQILDQLEGTGGVATLEELKQFALLETVFKKTHAVEAVEALQAKGKVEREKARKHADVKIRLAAPTLFDL